MVTRFAVFVLVLIAVSPASASDEVEALLLYKFGVQNKIETARLQALVNDAVDKSKELKDLDPDRGIDLLRSVVNRIDNAKLLNGAERRAMIDLVQPLVQELRDASLMKRRERAKLRVEAFKDYLEISALEGRYPGRSGSEHWEPASFMGHDGLTRIGKLIGLGTGVVTHKFGTKELNVVPLVMPLIQVYGGFYVFDKHNAHHVFMTNREFYDSVWSRLVPEYALDDVPGKKQLSASELAHVADKGRLHATVETGEFFLRSLSSVEPIAGVGTDEGPFLTFLAQTLKHRGLPVPIDRVYTREMQDRLAGFSPLQLSATRRTLALLQAKDASVSPLYGEIMRDETTKLLRSEYSGFSENEANRAVLYVFSKLK